MGQGALAFPAASTPMRTMGVPMVGAVFGVPALPLPGTHRALHLQKNMPPGLFGSSVLDKPMTIWRKDKFEGKGMTDIMGKRDGEWGDICTNFNNKDKF